MSSPAVQEQKRKNQNKIWGTKNSQKTLHSKTHNERQKVMHVIFFSNQILSFKKENHFQIEVLFHTTSNSNLSTWCKADAEQVFFTQGIRCMKLSDSCQASSPYLFARFCPLWLFPGPKSLKTNFPEKNQTLDLKSALNRITQKHYENSFKN